MGDHCAEDRQDCIKRLKRLFEVASLTELEETEQHLKRLVGSRVEVGNNKVQNRTGCKLALPCKQCGGARPPASGHAPWHLRVGQGGQLLAKSGVCAPCVWAGKNKRQREEWHNMLLLLQNHGPNMPEEHRRNQTKRNPWSLILKTRASAPCTSRCIFLPTKESKFERSQTSLYKH